eukprot:gene9683-1889_t
MKLIFLVVCVLLGLTVSLDCQRRHPPLFPRYYKTVLEPNSYIYQTVPVNTELTTDVECKGGACEVLYFKNQQYFQLWARGIRLQPEFYFQPPTNLTVTCQVITEDFDVPSYEGSRFVFFAVKNPSLDEKVNVEYNLKFVQSNKLK